MGSEITGPALDAIVGGRVEDHTPALLDACDDILTAISYSDIDDTRVENKAQALAAMVAAIRRT